MSRVGAGWLVAVVAVALGGCASGSNAFAETGTPLDEVCDPRNGMLPAPVDTLTVGWARVEIPKGWTRNASNGPRLSLRRVNSVMTLTEGMPLRVPFEQPLWNANRRCELDRSDTSIVITASRGNSVGFNVLAWWQTESDGPLFQIRLQTTNLQDLKRIRGTIESVRFPIDTARARGGRTQGRHSCAVSPLDLWRQYAATDDW
ncbi:MAG: hypothetical protein HC794_07345 [Nitrospiraceae bacterium]|nr:hypothetical protein [Nitrospiraceae bacterium]